MERHSLDKAVSTLLQLLYLVMWQCKYVHVTVMLVYRGDGGGVWGDAYVCTSVQMGDVCSCTWLGGIGISHVSYTSG